MAHQIEDDVAAVFVGIVDVDVHKRIALDDAGFSARARYENDLHSLLRPIVRAIPEGSLAQSGQRRGDRVDGDRSQREHQKLRSDGEVVLDVDVLERDRGELAQLAGGGYPEASKARRGTAPQRRGEVEPEIEQFPGGRIDAWMR
ncbi:hypothetical protein MAUB1S_04791 [Mycolicibacterium aubagnense]